MALAAGTAASAMSSVDCGAPASCLAAPPPALVPVPPPAPPRPAGTAKAKKYGLGCSRPVDT